MLHAAKLQRGHSISPTASIRDPACIYTVCACLHAATTPTRGILMHCLQRLLPDRLPRGTACHMHAAEGLRGGIARATIRTVECYVVIEPTVTAKDDTEPLHLLDKVRRTAFPRPARSERRCRSAEYGSTLCRVLIVVDEVQYALLRPYALTGGRPDLD